MVARDVSRWCLTYILSSCRCKHQQLNPCKKPRSHWYWLPRYIAQHMNIHNPEDFGLFRVTERKGTEWMNGTMTTSRSNLNPFISRLHLGWGHFPAQNTGEFQNLVLANLTMFFVTGGRERPLSGLSKDWQHRPSSTAIPSVIVNFFTELILQGNEMIWNIYFH